MSFRSNKQSVRPRSSSVTRNSVSSSSYNRPRSTGFFPNPYTPSYTPTPTSYSSYNGLGSNYNVYSSNYNSPYYNGYRASIPNSYTASLSIPAKLLSNYNVGSSPSYSKKYERDYGQKTAGHRQSRSKSRTSSGSFSRDRSLSRTQSEGRSTGMGSKSLSLTSLNSEGYCVRICLVFKEHFF